MTDDMVRAALKKWPGVPACYGWLALDARGDWYMRDEHVQAKGPFPSEKGSRIVHGPLRDFIARNYEATDDGRWYFQNGPQRVYVELEAAPQIWRLFRGADTALGVCSHTGCEAKVESSWLDEGGRLFLVTDGGFGIVHSQDMIIAADAVEAGIWRPGSMTFAAMPSRFGYVLSPAQNA